MDNGYTYTGDDSSFLVTMLRRDTKRKTAKIYVERNLTRPGDMSLPVGNTVTVPLRRVTVNKKAIK